jgi:2-keto-4-pentenoate hydratase/2-oxohepta-3-ene-1,7-dioic acid hydratase in catechol pathway
MRIATIKLDGAERAGIVAPHGVVLVAAVNAAKGRNWHDNVLDILVHGQLDDMAEWYRNGGETKMPGMKAIPFEGIEFAPLYRRPRKIIGVGINYVEQAAQLAAAIDEEPVTFLKPDTTIIGPHDPIVIPPQSERTTAEAELAIIIGKPCRNLSEEEAPKVIAGYTTALDMTAADIHQRNPRFMARAKSFDTFFSFGSHLVTPDEIADLSGLRVSTVHNGSVCSSNIVTNMRFNPLFQVSFFSKVMSLLPGDIILTGTPGSVPIRAGDRVECRIDGFETLSNPVIRAVT